MRPQSTSLARRSGDSSFIRTYHERLGASAQSSIEEQLTGTVFREAKKTVISAEMGTSKGNAMIDAALDKLIPNDRRVLIGGPPCQAYSLVGRARNAGKADYDPKADHRNYLYTEYLRVLEKISPAIFVMENVKGINSAKIEGQSIVGKILRDLADLVRQLVERLQLPIIYIHLPATYQPRLGYWVLPNLTPKTLL